MKAIVQTIAQALVDDPGKVNVSSVDGGHTSILRLRVGQGEAGKIIGKKGRTIDAIRTILNAIAAREGKRVVFEIADDELLSETAMARARVLPIQSSTLPSVDPKPSSQTRKAV